MRSLWYKQVNTSPLFCWKDFHFAENISFLLKSFLFTKKTIWSKVAWPFWSFIPAKSGWLVCMRLPLIFWSFHWSSNSDHQIHMPGQIGAKLPICWAGQCDGNSQGEFHWWQGAFKLEPNNIRISSNPQGQIGDMSNSQLFYGARSLRNHHISSRGNMHILGWCFASCPPKSNPTMSWLLMPFQVQVI